MTKIEKWSNGGDSNGKSIFAAGNRYDFERPEGFCPEVRRFLRDA